MFFFAVRIPFNIVVKSKLVILKTLITMTRTRLFVVLTLALFLSSCVKDELTVAPTAAIETSEKIPTAEFKDAEELVITKRRANILLLKVENAKVQAGQSFCLDVKAWGFKDLLAWQYSIAWDADVLAFSHVSNFNVPGLSTINFANPQSDRLTTSWTDPTLVGVTLPRNTPLYSICFDAVGDAGDKTAVSVTDNPTPIEVIDVNFEPVGLWARRGRVKLN